uniref:Uncharacterized protein n=1 Tax=Mantoniella antarctica TaxID=81844 RepID=A0A7S0X8Q2_9CHLO|mmetsp:Transcript_2712/g.6524  ORF Transcript_2712/g.6524 Transcript_2712/m.6524 type:complete len:132 (+) Transcript_2712:692-1087(+)
MRASVPAQPFHLPCPTIHRSTLLTLSADEFAAEVMRRRRHQGKVLIACLSDGQKGSLREDPNNEIFTVGLVCSKELSVRFQDYKLLKNIKLFNHEFADINNTHAEDAVAPMSEQRLRLALRCMSSLDDDRK